MRGQLSPAPAGLVDWTYEMGAQAADEPLEKDLEYGGGDQGIEQTDGGIVDVPEAADSDLHDEKHSNWDQSGKQCSSPDRDNLMAQWVCKLRVHDLAVLEVNRKRTRGGGLGFVDSEADCAHADHGQDVGPALGVSFRSAEGQKQDFSPGDFEPLAEARPLVQRAIDGPGVLPSSVVGMAILHGWGGAGSAIICRLGSRRATVEERHVFNCRAWWQLGWSQESRRQMGGEVALSWTSSKEGQQRQL